MDEAQAAEIGRVFIRCSADKLVQMRLSIHASFEKLDDELIWRRDASAQNAVGNLVLHLCGNVRQWIGAYVGGLPDVRHRPSEFDASARETCTGLLALLDETVALAVDTLGRVEPEKLAQRIPVQDGRVLTVLEAIYQVVGHFQLHTGQILFATKLWTNQDLGLYKAPQPTKSQV